jgi:hypothetical protein
MPDFGRARDRSGIVFGSPERRDQKLLERIARSPHRGDAPKKSVFGL